MIEYLEHDNDIIWIRPWEKYKSWEISESNGFLDIIHNLPQEDPLI